MHALFFMLVCLSSVSSGETPRVERASPMSPQGVVPQHVMVYHKPGRCGMGFQPINHGQDGRATGNEMWHGLAAHEITGRMPVLQDLGPNLHAIDRDKPEENPAIHCSSLVARRSGLGRRVTGHGPRILTWQIEDPSVKGALVPAGKALHGVAPPGFQEKSWRDCPGGIDFTHPDFAMTIRMSDKDTSMSRFYSKKYLDGITGLVFGQDNRISRIYFVESCYPVILSGLLSCESCQKKFIMYSTDRGHNWEGPFRLPLWHGLAAHEITGGLAVPQGIAARTDYLVNGKHDCMLALTAAKQNQKPPHGDGGVNRLTLPPRGRVVVSYIGPEPAGYAIMPSTARLSPTEILTTIRLPLWHGLAAHEITARMAVPQGIDAYLSRDNGDSWSYLNRPVPDTGEGRKPPHGDGGVNRLTLPPRGRVPLIRLHDGRLCLTYGCRAAPWGIYARLSDDGGRTWSDPIALREDGGGRDIGYPRSVERPDGKVVTVYYFWDQKTGPERYIAATIWDPDKAPMKSAGAMKAAVSVQRVFGPEHPGGRYKHPASITQLANDDLYLTYYTGSGEYATDTAVYGARLPKGQTRWTTPVPIADTPFRSEGNPVVWQAPDGMVWLFYVVRYGQTWSTSLIQAKISRDGAATWSDPMLLTMTEGMMVRNRPLALANGDILLPAYHETGHDTEMVGPDSCSLFFRWDAQHHTWTETNRIRSRIGNIQPAVAPITNDYLVCYCRRGGDYSGRPDGRIVRAESRDGGRTWSDGEETEFPNPNAAVEFLRLKSGNLLLIFNNSTNARTPLTAALSTDGDKTYPYRRNLIEGPGDYAYPYAIQADDGKIHLVFTSDERTTVYHAVFEEADVLGHRSDAVQ